MILFSRILVGIAIFATAAIVERAQAKPQFDQFRVPTVFRGRHAPVKLKPADMSFRTRIRGAAKDKPNFAGEYILAIWGCGAECLSGVVIGARTGRVYDLPFTICCWGDGDPMDFKLTSRLIVFRGLRNESEKDGANDFHFYEFRNGLFRHIRSIKQK